MHDDDDDDDDNVDEEEDGKAVKQPNWKRNQQEIELRAASCVCAAWAALTVGLSQALPLTVECSMARMSVGINLKSN